jgi:hypothetical protein
VHYYAQQKEHLNFIVFAADDLNQFLFVLAYWKSFTYDLIAVRKIYDADCVFINPEGHGPI